MATAASPPSTPAAPHRRGLRKRLCACALHRWAGPYERLIGPRKRTLLAGLRGHIVEIGPGAGANLPYLTLGAAEIRYTALEPNAYLHAPLRERAGALGISMDLRACAIGPGRADLPDGCADVVLCTLVLCSVADQRGAMGEIARLLRPGGRFVFIEHVAAPRGTLLRAMQRMLRPAWRIVGDGCEPDRETEPAIRGGVPGAFERLDVEAFLLPVPIVGPHIAGMAVRAGGGVGA